MSLGADVTLWRHRRVRKDPNFGGGSWYPRLPPTLRSALPSVPAGTAGGREGIFFTAVANYETYRAILSSTSNYLFTFFFFPRANIPAYLSFQTSELSSELILIICICLYICIHIFSWGGMCDAFRRPLSTVEFRSPRFLWVLGAAPSDPFEMVLLCELLSVLAEG